MTDSPPAPENSKIVITEGPILGQVARLAWPAVTSMFLRTAFTITNAIWVGRIGASPIAAVISSMFVIWILYSLIEIVTTGTVAVISRFYGARDFDRVAHAARQAVGFAVSASLVISIAGVIFAGLMFKIMNTGEEVARLGTPYLRIYLGASLIHFLSEVLYAIFRATGDTRTPLKVSLIAVGLNIILDPIFIFGWGPIPRLGVVGAAVGAVISVFVGLMIFLTLIRKGKLTFKFNWSKGVKPDFSMILQIAKIGMPLSVAGITFSIVYLFLNRITSSFGTEAIAALGIGNRCESLSYLVCWGFSIAVATLVGQNLGAGKPERASKSAWYSLGITGLITFVISMGFIIIPRHIASLFINDVSVVDFAVDYLIILGLSQSFMAVEIILEGAFSGAGDTFPPMVVSIVGSLARLPMAYFFSYNLGFGLSGVWWTMTITTWIKAIILMVWFHRGKWRYKQVHG